MKARRKPSRVVLNISGEIYETRKQTLRRFPNSLLGNWEKRMEHYSTESGQYCFQRSRLFFDAILFFYQSGGVLVCPPGIPFHLFEEECRFFELPETAIERIKPQEEKEKKEEHVQWEHYDRERPLRNRVWNILQNPHSSSSAFWFSMFSLLMINLSVIATCMESIPSLRMNTANFSHNPWTVTELILNTWFLLELTLSLACAPDLSKFVRKKMTWLDIIAVLPYFLILFISREKTQSLGFLRMVRIVRMFRLHKHSKQMELIGRILISALGDFRTLVMVVMLITVLASSCMYFIEGEGMGESELTSIPMGLYWGVQTIFTVGYGDVYPTTILGMMFAAAFMLIGPITMSIPLLSIISKFADEYEVKNEQA